MIAKKRILIYSPFYFKGHFGSWVKLIESALLSLGHSVLIYHQIPASEDTKPSVIKKIFKILRANFIQKASMYEEVSPVIPGGAYQLFKFLNDVNGNSSVKKFNPDLILYDFLDALDTDPQNWKCFYANFHYSQWAGIHIRPATSFIGGYSHLNSEAFKGVLFLSKEASEIAIERGENIPISFLPDISVSNLPHAKSKKITQILNKAAGRTVIFMGGSIGIRKNIFQWFKLIKLADPSKYFFIQMGEINRNEFSTRGLLCIDSFMQQMRENYYHENTYINSDEEFNELISNSDYIYAVYKDFEGTSNLVSKAAMFYVPIFVCKDSQQISPFISGGMVGGRVFNRNAKFLLDYLNGGELIVKVSHKKYFDGINEIIFQRNLNEFLGSF